MINIICSNFFKTKIQSLQIKPPIFLLIADIDVSLWFYII